MVTIMNDKKLRTVDDVRRFLDGATEVEFSIDDKAARYRWIQRTLVRLRYLSLGKKARGVVLRYLERVSGYSPRQIKRLVGQYVKHGRIERRQRTVVGFESRYTAADVVFACRNRCPARSTLRRRDQETL